MDEPFQPKVAPDTKTSPKVASAQQLSTFGIPLGLIGGVENTMEPAVRTLAAMSSVIADAYHHTLSTGKDGSAPLEFTGSRDILTHNQPGNKVKYEGFVLDETVEPRTVSASNTGKASKKRSAEVGRTVLDVLCVDNTGPIMITLWEDAAYAFIAIVHTNKVWEKRPLVLFEGLRIVELQKTSWHGEVLSTIRTLQSLPPSGQRAGTKVSLLEVATSPFTTTKQYISPTAPVAITEYLPFRTKIMTPPFKGNFVGTVVNVRAPDFSQQGLHRQIFDLIDESGSWITCCALGRCATSSALKNEFQVVIYNGTGRPKAGTGTAAVYLFKDAVVVPLFQKTWQTEKRTHIQM